MNSPASWAVDSVEVLADRRVRVKFVTTDNGRAEFSTRRFGVGKRGQRAANLAKFLVKSALGNDVEAMYHHIVSFPADWIGPLFFTDDLKEPALSLVS